jgi:Zinc finger, C2H2 type
MERTFTSAKIKEKIIKSEPVQDDEEVLPFNLENVKEEPPVEFLLILPQPCMKMEQREKGTIQRSESKVKCQICSKKVTKGFIKYHIKNHKKLRAFKCDLCGCQYNQKCLLVCHMWTHKDVKRFYCDICPKGFNYNSHLKDHRLTHFDSKPFKCDLCLMQFLNKQLVQSHLHRAHFQLILHCKKANSFQISDEEVKCKICGKSFGNKTFMKRHIERFHGMKNIYFV